jgi:predicted permease
LTAVDLSIGGYDETRGQAFERQLLERVRALPGVVDASVAAVMPLGGEGMALGNLSVPGATSRKGDPFVEADWNVVEPRYFLTMHMRLVAGRDFTDADRRDTPWVTIVNETAARRFWPGKDPLGQELVQSSDSRLRPDQHHLRIVGVVRDFKCRSLDDEPRAFMFVPVQQQYVPSLTIVARATGQRPLAGDIRSLVASMDRNLPILRAQRFEEFASIGLVPQRVAASAAGSLGIVGLLLAAMGIYGVTAYGVARRTREIGIRMALGAQRGDVVRMVLRQGLTMTLAGVAIGLPLAGGASLLLGSLLFRVPPLDPVTFTVAASLFAVVGLAACYVPARRATAIDAMEAVRYE